jgi:hypothetical protein
MPTSVANVLVVLSAFAFFSPAFSVIHEPNAEKAKQSIILGTEDAAALLAGQGKGNLSRFGVQIAGTYVVSRPPEAGPSRILSIFADGNLTSIQSTQFGGGGSGPRQLVQ